ncbi:MAG: DUF4870 domain-containing protein [Pyrinomonadaceae bacterium]|nr:DUF4870 domain-containing protein [Pyrinomonadaceae bacterium]
MENYSATGKSAIGLDANLAAALGYIISILGLINFIIDKENRFVRFHGIQSILYSVGIGAVFTVVWIVLIILGIVMSAISDVLGALMWLINGLLFFAFFLAMFGGLIYAAYKAYQGQIFKLPIVGNIAEKIVK